MVTRPLRLLVVDDHPLARKALVSLLREEPDLAIIGQAGDGRDALQQVSQTDPDVVLLDVRMPDLDGVATAQILRSEFPHVAVVGMVVGPEDPDAPAMCRAGAVTCVPKGSVRDLLIAIRACRERRPAA
jgi:DNA-binding NarL/FixJ family response regulator